MSRRTELPNVRKIIVPSPGYVLFDADLSGADAQVVAWEAEDEDLKAAFRAGLDVHAKNAEDMLGTKFTSLPIGSYARDVVRQNNKRAVHGTNYGVTPPTLARHTGWTVHEADQFQKRWFSLHPGIKTKFQGRIVAALESPGKTIYNAYGFRRQYFDRPGEAYTEALAWKPQSTVALATYFGAFSLESHYPQVEFLLQDHDSLVFQFPKTNCPSYEEIKTGLTTVTPYPDPLTIPWGLSVSTRSWGEVVKLKDILNGKAF